MKCTFLSSESESVNNIYFTFNLHYENFMLVVINSVIAGQCTLSVTVVNNDSSDISSRFSSQCERGSIKALQKLHSSVGEITFLTTQDFLT